MEELILQNQLFDSIKKHHHNIAIDYGEKKITYLELDKKSAFIARWIHKNGIEKGSFIGIFVDDKIELIAIMIGILKAGGVFIPLDTALPIKRIDNMVRLTNIEIIFADPDNKERLFNFNNEIEKKSKIFVVSHGFYKYDELLSTPGDEFEYDPEDRIYVYHTSGSTGVPKAIIGKNKSLLHFINWELDTFHIDETFRVSQLIATGFDAFLRDVYVPLCAGATLCIPWRKETVADGEKLVKWIEKNHITLIHCVPSIFRLFNSRELTPDHFRCLKYVLLSGEKIISHELAGWYRTFGERIQLVNLYGPTETTLVKTYYFIRESDVEKGDIPIGKPMPGVRAIILDTNMNLCPPGNVGEIYIRTPYRTHGYYNDDDLNVQRFLRNPYTSDPDDLIYKTGDLGRLLPDGNIEFLGRLDRQVKIRGTRIELEEIESVLLGHPVVKEAAVIKVETSNRNELLCAYITEIEKGKPPGRNSLRSSVKEYLSERLPDYMIPAPIEVIEEIPKKPNGKLDYEALQHLFKEETSYCIPPGNDIESKLLEFWREILGIEKIGITHDFFKLGGNSLNIMTLVSRIHREYDVRLTLGEIFTHSTIQGQSRIIKESTRDKYYSLEVAEEKDYYPVSSAQKRLFILQQMAPGITAYNITQVVELEGEFQGEILAETFRKLIKRHESLRTSFEMIHGEPMQRIHHHVEFEIEYDSAGRTAQSAEREVQRIERDNERRAPCAMRCASTLKNFIRAFDLSCAPLLRVGLIKQKENKHILMVDMHHIISDGVSLSALIKNFMTLYNQEELPASQFQYKDFSGWQNREEQKDVVKQQKEYWLRVFEEEIPVLNISTDYPRPSVRSFEGDVLNFDLDIKVTNALNHLATQQGTTLFILLLAVFNVFLSKISGQEDIVVGSTVAGRRHADLEQIIGMFVNTLTIRNYTQSEKKFSEFLQDVKVITLNAFENQDYPFEELVEAVSVSRDMGRNPLFDIMFVLQNMDNPTLEIPGLRLKPYKYGSNRSQFDLTLQTLETSEGLVFKYEYCTKLFKKETIERFISYLKKVISSILKNPGQRIWEIEIIPEQEKKQILFDFNDTTAGFPGEKTLHELFEMQVKNTPGNVAVLHEDKHLTYSALNETSNQLARVLRERGVSVDHPVGIMVGRSLEMLIGILGILKAGGAYLPIDPIYPWERKEYILDHSETRWLLTQKGLQQQEVVGCQCFHLEDIRLYSGNGQNLENINSPNDLVYMIYTSGSTGRPKGVMIKHRAVVNYIYWAAGNYVKEEAINFPLYTSITFDLTVTSIFTPLITGNTIVVYGDEEGEGVVEKIMEDDRIGVVKLTPSHLKLVRGKKISVDKNNIKRLVVGGEDLEAGLARDISKKFNGNIEIYNEYGPTEATVGCMIYKFDPARDNGKSVPIGIPAHNTRLYTLDKHQCPVPLGVVGEIYIGGEGVARGYLKEEQLTSEKFLENPFAEGDQLYRTGDLGRWLPGGNMEFLGRIDHQVKIRGFRIEPGEIESHLRSHPDIKDAVVLDKEKTNDKYLCAYIVTDKNFEIPALRNYITMKLPDYMIPSVFIKVDEIPLTSNGKVDRQALDAYGTTFETGIEYVAPANELEKTIAHLWKEVLEVDRVGINDIFFEMGGTSLDIIKLNSKLKEEFQKDIPVVMMFKYPTVYSFARYLNHEGFTMVPDEEIDDSINRMQDTVQMLMEG